MRTQNAWIVAVAASGLGLGSFITSSAWTSSSDASKATTASFEDALSQAPLVDCGEGREALLEPVRVDGRTSIKVRCVRTQTEPITAEVVAPREPAVQVVRIETAPAPAPTPAVVPEAAPQPAPARAPETAPVEFPVRNDPDIEVEPNGDGDRSWKQRAVIIGGAAGAGTVIGAITKGKKGAAVGAMIGAASAAAYELTKKDRNRN